MRIAIVPSCGGAVARPHWNATFTPQIDFGDRSVHLAVHQCEALERLRPEETANFWGAASSKGAKVPCHKESDFVLFTGKSLVGGIGEVGVRFQSEAIAGSMNLPGFSVATFRVRALG